MTARGHALHLATEGEVTSETLAEAQGCTETHARRVLHDLRTEGRLGVKWDRGGNRITYQLGGKPAKIRLTPKRRQLLEELAQGGRTTAELSDALGGPEKRWSHAEVYRVARDLETGGYVERDGVDAAGKGIWALSTGKRDGAS